MIKHITITILLLSIVITVGCSSLFVQKKDDIRVLISKDVLSRMEKDFFHYKSEYQNIKKIMTDCVFQEMDLNKDGMNEIVVKINWLSEGRFNIRKGHNYVRGAHDQGRWHIYRIYNQKPDFIGTLKDGSKWEVLSSILNGYHDIETSAHESGNQELVDIYRFSNEQYRLTSSVLYQFNEDGIRKKLKILK